MRKNRREREEKAAALGRKSRERSQKRKIGKKGVEGE